MRTLRVIQLPKGHIGRKCMNESNRANSRLFRVGKFKIKKKCLKSMANERFLEYPFPCGLNAIQLMTLAKHCKINVCEICY